MKLTILTDNNTFIDRYYFGEPALSFYIEDGDETILFDTGYSDVYMKNARLMGLDLSRVDKLVISHGHVDHTGGLVAFSQQYWQKRLPLIAHPDAFDRKYSGGENTGSILDAEQLTRAFLLTPAKAPVRVTENILFLGEIPQLTDFEPRAPMGFTVHCGEELPDRNADDSALVYEGKDGIYIITGCSDSGICNIIEYAKQVTGRDRVLGVIGGFHLFATDERLEKTIEYFLANGIPAIYPCHCVSLHARAAMIEKLPVIETGTGFSVSF